MKKKLEADLMSIAHKVLQMKNKSDINQLCVETRKLYEKLTMLQFVEEHFEGAKPTIGQAEVIVKMKQIFEENQLAEVKHSNSKLGTVAENGSTVKEDLQEVYQDEIVEKEISAPIEVESDKSEPKEEGENEAQFEEKFSKSNGNSFMPAFELDIAEEVSITKNAEAVQISFEDFLGGDFSDTLFVKLEENKESEEASIDFELPKLHQLQENYKEEILANSNESKIVSLNDKFSQGINIDLNDRIGFIKNLFANSEEDYTRVLNQLITYDSFDEAKNFIVDMVKPDYDDWTGKEEYEQRFIAIIEKKFA